MTEKRYVGLSCHTVRLKRRHTSDDYLPLGKLTPTTALVASLKGFFDALKPGIHRGGKYLRADADVTTNGDVLSGTLHVGETGNEGESIVDVDSSEVVHVYKPSEAHMGRASFLFKLPPHKLLGVFLVERRGTGGVFTVLKELLSDWIAKVNNDVILELVPAMPKGALETLLKGRLTKIAVRPTQVPSDFSTWVSKLGTPDKPATLEITVRAPRKNALVGGKAGMIELPEFLGKESRIVGTYTVGSRNRSIVMGDQPFSKRPEFDISEEVKFGSDGLPDPASVVARATDLAEELLQEAVKLG